MYLACNLTFFFLAKNRKRSNQIFIIENSDIISLPLHKLFLNDQDEIDGFHICIRITKVACYKWKSINGRELSEMTVNSMCSLLKEELAWNVLQVWKLSSTRLSKIKSREKTFKMNMNGTFSAPFLSTKALNWSKYEVVHFISFGFPPSIASGFL